MFEYDLYLLCNIYMNYANSWTIYIYTCIHTYTYVYKYIYLLAEITAHLWRLFIASFVHMYVCIYIFYLKRKFNASISRTTNMYNFNDCIYYFFN